jgi:superfamily II DNA or RNA helicase
MPLSQVLARDCDPAIQQRGRHYLDSGRVRIDSGTASRVSARVHGTNSYRVDLARLGLEIRAFCTCPFFDTDICKHVWAVILAADARGLLQGDGETGRLRLVRAGDVDEMEDADTDGDGAAGGSDFRDLGPFRNRGTPPPASPSDVRRGAAPQVETPSWRKQLARLNGTPVPQTYFPYREWQPGRELLYVIDLPGSRSIGGAFLEIYTRDRKKDGNWAKPKSSYMPREWLRSMPDPDDRYILACLTGATVLHDGGSSGHGYSYGGASTLTGDYHGQAFPFRYGVREALLDLILPVLCRTGRCRLRLQPEDGEPAWPRIAWRGEDTWQFRVVVSGRERPDGYEVAGTLVRDAERVDLAKPFMLLHSGLVFFGDHIARLEYHGAFEWISLLREQGTIFVPASQADDFVSELLKQPRLPLLELPDELRYEEVSCAPRPRLSIKPAASWQSNRLHAKLTFDYEGQIVAREDPVSRLVETARRRVLLRDRAVEMAAFARLRELGWRAPSYVAPQERGSLEMLADRLPRVVEVLTAEGWHVEAEGKAYRAPGRFDLGVSSGIDWFELHGAVQYGDMVAHLPELLAALKRDGGMIRLGDGSLGLLPQDWLKKYGLLAGLGTAHGDHLRFERNQVGLLDVLLSTQQEARCDEGFARLRDRLQRFSGIHPAESPAGFAGSLRPYQREGLGWLCFLCEFGFGGCLADDMGLGKTVQVLALLEARRELRQRNGRELHAGSGGTARPNSSPLATRIGPSLVVMPSSLVFNWKQEAARFTPRLRILDHSGSDRIRGNEHFGDYDLILTTYATLRRDALDFKDVRFDYVILDEAQAIKNAASISAKAVRLLKAEHRLALSGTPIENHLGELWSLFEFLNPGMLGAASVFKLTQGGASRDPDEETRKLLARALRPFVLRRTKAQVVRDLPPKVEQTLYCELESKQRRLYDELRGHYRQALLKRIERTGIARSKIQILEALLRLRQAAIHPGLLDARRLRESSAKLDMLLPRLQEALDEGHKALVFSQFTSMLDILRDRLDHDGIAYEYLDGQTKDRESPVARFQEDKSCKVFLISLKAGGLGLNLTAAQYVFLLDPWWNPAVEAQAVDRAHRIGQTNRVIAYRLIARNTIEERVLELQDSKRALAEAIIGADGGLMRNLGREDLERLLS